MSCEIYWLRSDNKKIVNVHINIGVKYNCPKRHIQMLCRCCVIIIKLSEQVVRHIIFEFCRKEV